jgi:hypothetical protein
MSPYQFNKTISIGFPVLFLVISLYFTDINNPSFWWLLLIITHILGYTHFILGYFYQYKSLKRNPNKNLLLIFFLLTFGAILFALLFIISGNIALLAVIAIGYFITHGVLNEVTQMREFMGFAPRLSDMLSLVFYLLAFFLLSLSHPSFFFGPDLVFVNPTPEMAVWLLQTIVSNNLIQFLVVGCIVSFVVLLPGRLVWRGNYVAGATTALVGLSTLLMFYWNEPIAYIVLYFIALSYHFISWGVFIWQKFRISAPSRVRQYLFAHIYVAIPFVLSSVLLFNNSGTIDMIHSTLFNGLLFIIMAMIHNTTSLLNEDWFKKLL